MAHALSSNHSPEDAFQTIDSEALASNSADLRRMLVIVAGDSPKGGLPLVRAVSTLVSTLSETSRGLCRQRPLVALACQ